MLKHIILKDGWSRYFALSQAISNNDTQNTRHVRPLDSATGKRFNTYSAFSPTTKPANEFPGERILIFGLCLSDNPNRFPVQVLCWRLILGLSLPILNFGLLIGDSLRPQLRHALPCLFFFENVHSTCFIKKKLKVLHFQHHITARCHEQWG